MVLNGIENKITKIGAIDSIDINSGTNTMDTNSVSIIAIIDLVSTINSVEEESCECWWEMMNDGNLKTKIVVNNESIW
jgi:hypothetical protein